jgi:hypothetical protein
VICQFEGHPEGWQVRLIGPTGTIRAKVCRTQDEVLDTVDLWRDEPLLDGGATIP